MTGEQICNVAEALRGMLVPIEQLNPDPRNAVKHPERSIEAIKASLAEFGQDQPLVVQREGMVVRKGNGRLEAARLLGWTHIAAVVIDEETLRARARAVADNRSSDFREWDFDVLRDDLASFAEEFEFDDVMFDDVDLAKFERDSRESQRPDDLEDTPPPDPPETPVSVPGAVWHCGEHRLIVGDSTKAATWAALMGDDRAGMIVTSPPYWVGKSYEQESTWTEIQAFIRALVENMTRYVPGNRRIVLNTGTVQAGQYFGGRTQLRLLLDDWQRAFEDVGWAMRYARVWSKRGQLALVGPHTDVIDCHWELIGYFYDPSVRPHRGQNRVGGDGKSWTCDGVWEFHGEASAGGTHEAAFPLELPVRNILMFSDAGEIVLEPFSGSGTTMVACEKLGRRCRAIELLPKYADVSVRRWCNATGGAAEMFVDGELAGQLIPESVSKRASQSA